MAELVGGAFLSAFLQVLFDRLASKEFLDLFRGKKAVEELLRDLKIVLSSVNSLLNDAEEKQIRDENVKNWLDELKEVIYDADDLVDTIDGEALRCKLEPKYRKVIKNLFTSLNDPVKHEAEEILRRLNVLVDQKKALGLRDDQSGSYLQRPLAPLVKESDVYGRNDDKEVIVKLLLSNDASSSKISIIPIVGMGGIGKTTLAQLVFDDNRVRECFELKAWVTVSEEFDNFRIMKTIFEQVTSEKCNTEEPVVLQRNLKEALNRKKFLFVHDDVWNDKRHLWESLMSSYESGADGSKIIVTTRNESVASTMVVGKGHYLTDLRDEDCWQLFVKHAFGTDVNHIDASQDLQEVGREIVKKCKGLPLAIKSVGGLLRLERNLMKWKNILNNEAWNQLYKKEDNNILPALWLSYRHLPANLKPCFAYCSLFPKDYEFEREKLIMLWMAEGLLQTDNKDTTMEELGEEYLQDLLSRSLFQRSNQGESFLLMHDLVHDLAMFVSGEFIFKLDKRFSLDELPSKTRHLSYRKGSYDLNQLEGLCKAEHLRTFLALPLSRPKRLFPKKHSVPCNSLLKSGRFLRVLSLCQSSIEKLPNSVGKMKHLRYLDLSYSEIRKLPDSICTLYNLQVLLLSWCSNLTTLPKKMERLINLRHLDVEGVQLKEIALQLSNFKDLQTLPQMVLGPGRSGFKIKELKELRNLGGVLKISGLEHVDQVEAKEANLKDKKSLSYLSLTWSHDLVTECSQRERQILNELEPHTNLKGLEIKFYRGTSFSDWVGQSSFSNVVSISLKSCKECCLFPPLWQLPSLEDLMIDELTGVVSIGDGFYGNCPNSFRSLKRLTLRGMLEWKEWSFTEATNIQEGGVFPCLNQLTIENCPKLEVGLPGNLPSLERLSITKCLQMAVLLPRTQQTTVTSFPSLGSMSLTNCPALESLLECGSHSKVKSLRLCHCEKLFENRMHWDLQRRFFSLEMFEITGWEDESFPDDDLLPTALTRLEINFCCNLQGLNGMAFQQLTSLEHLQILRCHNLQRLPEERLPTSLSRLTISGCSSLKKRCQEDGEDWPKIADIASVSID